MLRVRQVKIEVTSDNRENLLKTISKKLKIDKSLIEDISIFKQSIDARDKNNIYYVYEVNVNVKNEQEILRKNKSNDILLAPNLDYKFQKSGTMKLDKRPIIVGSGPAGLFCAYILAENNYKPIVIERGEDVDKRVESVNKFWKEGVLNSNSNVQFGEGGAGTFSDGKLNTLVKDEFNRGRKVFETLVKFGAPEEILYSYKPHIGTDILRSVVKNMREEIKKMGGTFLYNTCLTDINIEDNQIKSIEINKKEIIDTNVLVLAIGHSARDTFEMLYRKNTQMTSKPFAIGLRVEHSQNMINESQYGLKYKDILPPASYKLTYQASNNRGVYSFCMCPGGYVVNASSEEGRLAINGMSYSKRDGKGANSAIVVTITPDDFGYDTLDGMKYQRVLEEKAFNIGKGKIPVQTLKGFKENSISNLKNKPSIKGEYTISNINEILPIEVSKSLKEAFTNFGKKIKGFDYDDTLLMAIESRTSSPIRILRDENLESSIKGIYPSGEGAGYAGGITSAAMDGIKIAEMIGQKYYE